MDTVELVITIILGYIFFLIEEFEASAWIAVSSILLSALITIPLSIPIFRRSASLVAFAAVTSLQLLLTAVFRVSLVYGEVLSYLRGVDAFGMLGLNLGTYIIFGVSGIIPAYCIRKYDPGPGFRLFPIVLSSLGVLYTYKLSSGFFSSITTLNGLLLLLAELTAPAVYGLLGVWTARYWSRTYQGIGDKFPRSEAPHSKASTRGPQVPRTWDNLPSMAMVPVTEPFSFQTLVGYVSQEASDKQLVCIVVWGWTVSQAQAFWHIQELYRFADDPSLVLMRFTAPAPSDEQLIVRASFMRDIASHVRATRLRELIDELSRLARGRGFHTATVQR